MWVLIIHLGAVTVPLSGGKKEHFQHDLNFIEKILDYFFSRFTKASNSVHTDCVLFVCLSVCAPKMLFIYSLLLRGACFSCEPFVGRGRGASQQQGG